MEVMQLPEFQAYSILARSPVYFRAAFFMLLQNMPAGGSPVRHLQLGIARVQHALTVLLPHPSCSLHRNWHRNYLYSSQDSSIPRQSSARKIFVLSDVFPVPQRGQIAAQDLVLNVSCIVVLCSPSCSSPLIVRSVASSTTDWTKVKYQRKMKQTKCSFFFI